MENKFEDVGMWGTCLVSVVHHSLSELHRWPNLQEHKRLEKAINQEDKDFTFEWGGEA